MQQKTNYKYQERASERKRTIKIKRKKRMKANK